MRTLFLAAAFAVAACASSLAQTGAGGFFTLHNDTVEHTVVGFYTHDGSGWSDNWLDDDLLPGESAEAEFFAATGPCEQVFQVGWLATDGGEVLDEPISIDICEASNVYLGDNEITFD